MIDHGRIDVEFGHSRTQALLPRAASFFGQHSVFLFGIVASTPLLRALVCGLVSVNRNGDGTDILTNRILTNRIAPEK